jgi:hypothetical protein
MHRPFGLLLLTLWASRVQDIEHIKRKTLNVPRLTSNHPKRINKEAEMKNLLLYAFCFAASSNSFAEALLDGKDTRNHTIKSGLFYPHSNQPCSNKKIDLAESNVNKELTQRGCCSWHGGVWGCSSGQAVCCDGNLSPGCGC